MTLHPYQIDVIGEFPDTVAAGRGLKAKAKEHVA
jgi:hypothetical protein